MVSLFSAQILLPGEMFTPLASTGLVFLIWIAVGVLAMIFGAVAVRVSIHRLRRIPTQAPERAVTFTVPSSAPSKSSARKAAA